MTVTFYRFTGSGHIQTDRVENVLQMTKQELMKIGDLRHPVLSKKDFFRVLSTDKDGNDKPEFDMMTRTHYLLVTK